MGTIARQHVDALSREVLRGRESNERRYRPALLLVSVRVKGSTKERISQAASTADQSISSWLRMAIMEKLERDEAR